MSLSTFGVSNLGAMPTKTAAFTIFKKTIEYQQASATSGGKSVRINQGYAEPASWRANKVHLRELLLKQVTKPEND
jgi:hypothetical protein